MSTTLAAGEKRFVTTLITAAKETRLLTEWSAIWSEITSMISDQNLQDPKFNYHFIRSVHFEIPQFRFWCNVPSRAGLLELVEPETLT